MPNLHPALAWLHTQATALFGFLGDVAANRPVPAGKAVLYTLADIAVIWIVLKIIKKVK